jgi:hypothetical protein
LYILKGFCFGKIESNDRTNRTPIISIGDGSKSLLPCGIPNLIFDDSALIIDGFCCEFYSDSGFGIHAEDIIYEAGEEVGFSNS